MHSAPPTSIAKPFFTDHLVQDPYPTYRRFLNEGPIHFLERGSGPGIWAIFSYKHCSALLKDPRLTARRSGSTLISFSPEQQKELAPLAAMLGQWMLFIDAPEHSRLRKLINQGFSLAVIDGLRVQVETVVGEMVGSLQTSSEVDLMKGIAHPLPVLIIGRMLGLPDRMEGQMTEWSDAIATFIGNPLRTLDQARSAQHAMLSLTDYFRQVVAERRVQKGSDLVSLLLEIEADGEVLTEDEVYAQCIMLLFAGHETTRNLIGNGMLTLLQRREELDRLREEPKMTRSAVEELLRFESPVQGASRLLREDMEIEGHVIRAGSPLFLMLGSANRDPQQFPDPDRLDLARLNNSHLAFGAGAHFCIGNQIARLEAQVAILQLVQTFPKMQLAGSNPGWLPNFALRGLSSLPVLLTA